MILKSGEEWEPTDEDVIEWQSTYKQIDVFVELKKMSSWLDANPSKRKTKAGIKRFVNSWLSRAEDRGGSPAMASYQRSGKKTPRELSNLDDITDITWLEGHIKERMREVFTEKYGQAYDG